MKKIKEELNAEAEQISMEHRLSSTYKRKKLIIWFVRTSLSIVLYIIFWKYEWVRWTLVLYIPLAIFNLVMILGFNYLLDRKMKKLNSQINKINLS